MIDPGALLAKPTLLGERVRLRPLAVGDAPALHAAAADPELRRLTGTHARFDLEDLERWCGTRDGQPDRLDLAIERIEDGAVIGDLALLDASLDDETAGFRIALHATALGGRGYGSEAAALVLRHAFTAVGLHRVELEVFAFNSRARRAYERAGFEEEGVRREVLLWDGERHDAVLMAALAPRWLARAG